MIGPERYENGMTVAELKELVADLPEKDVNGDPTQVWIGRNGESSPVFEAWPLNKCPGGSHDLLLET